jgi:hypothetical protein
MTTKVKPSVLADTAVTAGTYGGSSQQAVFTVDAQGRLTYAGNATPSIATSQLTGTISATQVANNQTYGINVSGNSGTVTNGVYTSGSYSDPSWLTISKSKVGLGNVDNTADASKSVSYATTAGNGGVTSVNGNTGDVSTLGYGQSWTNVTSSRVAGTTYTNSTGKPIQVCIGVGDDNQNAFIVVGGVNVARFSYRNTACVIVPNGTSYKIDTGITFGLWTELR